MFYVTEIIDNIHAIPLLSVITFLPIFILINKVHKKKNDYLTKRKVFKSSNFKFHFANLLLTGGLYSVYTEIIAYPIHTHHITTTYTVFKLIITIALYLLFLSSIKIWFTTDFKFLKVLYVLYGITLLQPGCFFYSYFYLSVIVKRILKNKYNTNESEMNLFFYRFIPFIMYFLGIVFYIYWDFLIEPSAYY